MAIGRPKIVITPEILAEVEELAANGLTNDQISESLGWCRDTFRRKKKDFSAFSASIKKGQAQGIAKVANALFENALKGNLGAQCFYLKNHAGWVDKTETAHSGSDVPIKHDVTIHYVGGVKDDTNGFDDPI